MVTDVGQHQMWEAQYYQHEHPRSLITSGGLGTMGFALPAAIGAQDRAARRGGVGDRRRRRLPDDAVRARDRSRRRGSKINIAIINNGYLGMVRQWQEFFYERRYAATPLRNPDFVQARGGVRPAGHRRHARGDVVPAIQAREPTTGAVLIDFRVEQEDTVYPMVPAGADLHAMIRRPSPHRRTEQTTEPTSEAMTRSRYATRSSRYVEDEPGVFNRVASLFRRRAFNIESLTVGHTEKPGVSRMTIVVRHRRRPRAAHRGEPLQAGRRPARRRHRRRAPTVARDLAMIKVRDDAGLARRRHAAGRRLPRARRRRRRPSR